ncbi:MAG: STAS domain-containing protein, partial [Solirubrobacteraceae bacterium]
MDGPGGTDTCLFEIKQRQDADGALRMTLRGELDLSVTDGLRAQLAHAQRSQRPVRLDLSELEFVDCGGIRAILSALAEARAGRRKLEVSRTVSPMVERFISLAALASDLWPDEPESPAARRAAAA